MYFYAYFILYLHLDENIQFCRHKAELLLLKLIHLFAREVLLVKLLEVEDIYKTHPFICQRSFISKNVGNRRYVYIKLI